MVSVLFEWAMRSRAREHHSRLLTERALVREAERPPGSTLVSTNGSFNTYGFCTTTMHAGSLTNPPNRFSQSSLVQFTAITKPSSLRQQSLLRRASPGAGSPISNRPPQLPVPIFTISSRNRPLGVPTISGISVKNRPTTPTVWGSGSTTILTTTTWRDRTTLPATTEIVVRSTTRLPPTQSLFDLKGKTRGSITITISSLSLARSFPVFRCPFSTGHIYTLDESMGPSTCHNNLPQSCSFFLSVVLL